MEVASTFAELVQFGLTKEQIARLKLEVKK